jgi:AraC family transcriptional regulator
MDAPLNVNEYLHLNRGRYIREVIDFDRVGCRLYLTGHSEVAATDLPHYHDTAHLSFIIDGGVVDRRGSFEKERQQCELMFFRSGEMHQSIYYGFPVRNLNIEFDSQFFADNDIDESQFSELLNDESEARLAMIRLLRELTFRDPDMKESVESLLIGLCEGKVKVGRSRPAWLDRVAEILNDEWNCPISMGRLAAAVGVHPKTISRYFPIYFGCSFGQYRRRLRISRAVGLMRSQPASLTQIALECGFFDQSHFVTAFKKLTGILPKQFRQI